MNYSVNEIFNSIQGEGVYVGKWSTFIRLAGCNVRCPWCDTKASWTEGIDMPLEQIMKWKMASHVVITGGEPLLQDLDELIHALHMQGCYVQIETSGGTDFKGLIYPNWITWSPKPSLDWFLCGDGWVNSLAWKHINEVKWVVEAALTSETVSKVNDALQANNPINIFMPEGCPPSRANVEQAINFVKQAPVNSDWRYGDRLQWRLGVR